MCSRFGPALEPDCCLWTKTSTLLYPCHADVLIRNLSPIQIQHSVQYKYKTQSNKYTKFQSNKNSIFSPIQIQNSVQYKYKIQSSTDTKIQSNKHTKFSPTQIQKFSPIQYQNSVQYTYQNSVQYKCKI